LVTDWSISISITLHSDKVNNRT